MSIYGFSCWQCREQFNGEEDEMAGSVADRAGMAGWCLGHADGQGHYVCPDHKECVNEPHPITGQGYN
jgi:hypothetical protein